MELPDDLVPLPSAPWDQRPTELPLDAEECRTAIWLANGNIKEAASILKVSSQRFRSFVKNSEYLSREMQEAQEILKDLAEKNVYDALTDAQDSGRRDSMSRFVLASIGKDRGYGSGGSGVQLTGTKGRMVVTWQTDESPAIDGTSRDISDA